MADLRTPQFRVSYPNVFEKRMNTLSNKQEYSLQALFPKGTDFSVMDKAAQAAVIEKFGKDKKKWPTFLQKPWSQVEKPWKPMVQKPNKETGEMEWPNGHAQGGYTMTLKTVNELKIVDGAKNEILDPIDFYAGCYAKAFISIFAYDAKVKQGISSTLLALQKVGEGDSLGGRQPVNIDTAFEQVELSDDDTTKETSTSGDALFG